MTRLKNIVELGIKELRSLYRDPVMLILIAWTFSYAIYSAAKATPETLQNAPIAIVDEDHTSLSYRIIDSMHPPQFQPPTLTSSLEASTGMDTGKYSFSLDIPPNFQRDIMAGKQPVLQLNVDATLIAQAFNGDGIIENIINGDATDFSQRYRSVSQTPVLVIPRNLYNENLTKSWFVVIMQIVNNVTMLSMILTGAALIREREHGTIEHLLAMPITPAEVMVSKVWSMGLVVLLAAWFALEIVAKLAIGATLVGSIPLFLLGAALCLLATTAMGIFLATIATSMPQFGLLMIIVLLPMQILSGSTTPYDSMPLLAQKLMLVAPTTQFVVLGQAILYRGAGISVVWPQFLALLVIAAVLFTAALLRFRSSIGSMQG